MDATRLWRADFANADVEDDEWLVERQKPGATRGSGTDVSASTASTTAASPSGLVGVPADLVVGHTATCAQSDGRLTVTA